jgi:predicted transcriptional regulator of viral defense system
MTFKDLKLKIKTPIFSQNDVAKVFPMNEEKHINTQLHRMAKRGDLVAIKRGLYSFSNTSIDEFVVANKIYSPSYVSLESSLNAFGIIPDIPFMVTSISPVTTKQVKTSLGNFSYSKIKNGLFFGFTQIKDEKSGLYYNMATPEKAFLDYIYIRKIIDLAEARIEMVSLDKKKLQDYATHFPNWVRKVLTNA